LYRANIAAKEHAQEASDAYETGFKHAARVHSQKKKALYNLKRAALGEFVDNGCVTNVTLHEINNRQYYCVSVGDHSFHTPISEWDTPPAPVSDSPTVLDDFSADPAARDTTLSEHGALTRLSDAFESPNTHVESPFTTSGFNHTFVGWNNLPGALEPGDRVPDEHLHDRHGEADFGLAVGDTFNTSNGHCEILARYHAYLPPHHDRSPLLQRPAYDVVLDGDRKETVSQRRIVDDWWLLADSIATPLPGVTGRFGDPEYVRGHLDSHVDTPIEFEIGDVLELHPPCEDKPVYCRLTEVHVSHTLLLGQYEPVPPTETAPLGLSIHEIADDVVAVHNTPSCE